MSTSPTTTPVLGEATIQELRGALRGQVLTPGDPGYDDARKVYNAVIDKRPALIARCAGVADVTAAIQFARSQHLTTAIHGGGHSQSGLALCDGGLVIDLSAMRGVRVDPVARTAHAAGGATWGDYDHEAQAFGLGSTGGLISTTGIAGLTLGGGIGWLARKQGLSCDTLIAADVVTADGRFITASETEHPDLFWALRGGGGNFGVVTSFLHRLQPVGTVLGGLVLHPFERAREVLQFFREQMDTAPDELNMFPAFLTVPPAPPFPEHLQGRLMIALVACAAGPQDEAERLVGPLRTFGPPLLDLLGPLPYATLQAMFDIPPGLRQYWKADYFDALSDAAIDTLIGHAEGLRGLAPISTIHIYPLGGAIGRVAPDATAFRHRQARYTSIIASIWEDPAQDAPHVAWVRDLWQALRPHATGGVYVNFLGEEGHERVRDAYGANYDRLVQVKRTYDPTNFFRVNQNIAP